MHARDFRKQGNKMRVLCFPCASGIGQEVWMALHEHRDIELFGLNAGSQHDHPGGFLYQNYIGNAPAMTSGSLIPFMKKVIEEYNIEYVFPCYDDATVYLSKHRAALLPAVVVAPEHTIVEICRSKTMTYNLLRTAGLAVPKQFSVSDLTNLTFPVFIKPDTGEGSRGAQKIDSATQLAGVLKVDDIVLEYLPGDEYTVDCLSDANGCLLFAGPRKRTLARAGISILSETIVDNSGEFAEYASGIVKAMKMTGAWFFQVKRDVQGGLCLLEVAPRIAGAMCTSRGLGVNFPLLALMVHSGKSVSIVKQSYAIKSCKLYHNYYSAPDMRFGALYIDLDDTLLLPGGYNAVNADVLGLCYKARSAGLPVYLITRHKGDVADTLDQAAISRKLFKQIIHITDKSQSKAMYITDRPAALVDDSFSERIDCVASDCFVFDVDAVGVALGAIQSSQRSSSSL